MSLICNLRFNVQLRSQTCLHLKLNYVSVTSNLGAIVRFHFEIILSEKSEKIVLNRLNASCVSGGALD